MSKSAVPQKRDAIVPLHPIEREQIRSLEINLIMSKRYRNLLADMTKPDDVKGQAAIAEADVNIGLLEKKIQSLQLPLATA